MGKKLNFQDTKETLDKILAQAKESVKVLDALQKEGVARAKSMTKSMMDNAPAELAQKLSSEKITQALKKMGLATRTEVRDLERKVEDLASELRAQISKVAKKTNAPKKPEKDDTRDTDTHI